MMDSSCAGDTCLVAGLAGVPNYEEGTSTGVPVTYRYRFAAAPPG